MSGGLTLHAEILGGFNQASAEEHLPEPIDRNTGGERVIGRDKPLGQPEPVVGCVRRHGWEVLGGPGSYFLAPLVVEPLLQHERLPKGSSVFHHHGPYDAPFEGVPCFNMLPQRSDLLHVIRMLLFERRFQFLHQRARSRTYHRYRHPNRVEV